MRRVGSLLWIALLIAQAASAQTAKAQVFELDASRSHAAFEVKVLYLIGLHGEFGSVRGTLSVDNQHGTAAVDATIDTNAVHMRSRRYETWTKSTEFFDAQHFPQIHFASDSFPIARLTDGGQINGALTIRGVTRDTAFEIDVPDCDATLAGKCAVAVAGTIRRSEFGMRSRRGALSDRVDLSLYIFVRPTPK